MAARRAADQHYRETSPGQISQVSAGREILHPGGGQVIVLLDEMRLTRECICQLLQESAPDLDVYAVAHASEFLSPDARRPDLMIINLKTAGLSDPKLLEAREILRSQLAGVPVLLISEETCSTETALEAIAAGTNGYFPACLSTNLLVAAVRLAAAGGVFLPPGLLREFAAQRGRSSLIATRSRVSG